MLEKTKLNIKKLEETLQERKSTKVKRMSEAPRPIDPKRRVEIRMQAPGGTGTKGEEPRAGEEADHAHRKATPPPSLEPYRPWPLLPTRDMLDNMSLTGR